MSWANLAQVSPHIRRPSTSGKCVVPGAVAVSLACDLPEFTYRITLEGDRTPFHGFAPSYRPELSWCLGISDRGCGLAASRGPPMSYLGQWKQEQPKTSRAHARDPQVASSEAIRPPFGSEEAGKVALPPTKAPTIPRSYRPTTLSPREKMEEGSIGGATTGGGSSAGQSEYLNIELPRPSLVPFSHFSMPFATLRLSNSVCIYRVRALTGLPILKEQNPDYLFSNSYPATPTKQTYTAHDGCPAIQEHW